jgi:hypothetical protein
MVARVPSASKGASVPLGGHDDRQFLFGVHRNGAVGIEFEWHGGSFRASALSMAFRPSTASRPLAAIKKPR